ncbi:MAG TPA: SDR family NAD(P)-dependent oxidoreductase [Acidimicrobiia bacterium]|nr:SDR family NAD(P)-dependent oxidoreductase [Acidimicrobiia bacterium]
MHIAGQGALVFGGASGLGEATAFLLAERGASVVVADRDTTRGPKVAAGIGGRFVETDVTDEDGVAAAVGAAGEGAPLRMAVNCAGIGWAERLLRPDGTVHAAAGFEKVVRVNLLGSFHVLRLAAAAMAATDPADGGERGVVINTASVAAFDGQVGQVAYAASKGAVTALTLPAARDLAPVGIRVCTIVPGLMDTPLAGKMPERNRASIEAQVPYPARFGQPAEFAALAVHIVENQYLNGTCIRLDAGLRLAYR